MTRFEPMRTAVRTPVLCCNHPPFLLVVALLRVRAPLRFLPVPKVCTELITNNAAAALAVPIALSIAKELEVRENRS